MNSRSVKIALVAASVVGLTGLATTAAWAETFTPGIEEPSLDLGFGEDGGPLTRNPDGNSSSAEGRDGVAYGDGPYSFDDSASEDDDPYNLDEDASDNDNASSGRGAGVTSSDDD